MKVICPKCKCSFIQDENDIKWAWSPLDVTFDDDSYKWPIETTAFVECPECHVNVRIYPEKGETV